MKAIFRYPGSKWSIADWIIDHFPDGYEKMVYLEPFAGSGALYAHEMDASGQEELLRIIKSSHAKIIISGYESDLYNTALAGWHKDHTMSQTTSTEMAEETIWMNYEPPTHQLSIFENNGQ